MFTMRYFSLRAHFHDRETDLSCSFKLQELESIWFCTNKNSKRILKEMTDRKWLNYKPGKGRGHHSTLTFYQPFQKEVEDYVKTCVESEKLDQVAQLLRLPIPKAWIAKSSSDIRRLFSYDDHHQAKDVLHAFITRDFTTLDPLEVAVTFEAHLIEQLGDSLLNYDAEKDAIIPHIAHHYEENNDGEQWTFHLRKGVQFHHREELTSRDVAATIRRVQNGPASSAWMAADIERVDCPHPYKIIVHLKKPNPFFPRYMASSNFCILPEDVPFDEWEWIGTGPFFLKQRTENKIVLGAFDSYFKERPLLDEVSFFKVSREAASAINLTVDEATSEIPASKDEIETGFRFLTFNFHKRNVVQSPAFREAVFHLLNIKKMAMDLEVDQYVEASSFVPWRSKHLQKDESKITALLDESGYRGEKLRVYHLDFPNAVKEADWLVKEGRKYGIHFESHSFNFSDMYNRTIDSQIDLIFMGEVSSLDYHLSFLGAFYNDALLFRRLFPKQGLEWIDQHLEKIKRCHTAEEREKLMNKIESYIKDNHLLIFQHHPIKVRTFHPLLQGVRFQSFGHFDFSKMWISK
ncbi:ABC transporter substrate-binding protein [Halobacillus litoralis]|uniref:ABC transporter substrate-binding protein n=1 Tax=Halobacillus litoralis TaxID=45668 RepID=A0A410MID2_9BACI|nr:ABC transporter substrate-binding protein [Halobacillus litoralis]QAS54416.1 hypothetical protein HLI_20435 [Halobacillus litoralis]